MCGIAGFWVRRYGIEQAKDILNKMGGTIKHRGPNDMGQWYDEIEGIGLSHRRLSILDLSQAGHQPMQSISGKYVIVFNGEIYNHIDIRTELKSIGIAPSWRGHSDTETLLAAFEAWGIVNTLKRTVGMFAIALWDRANRTLTLVRDRLGEKPLYYGLQNGVFLFGSELKALKSHPAFSGELDRDALTLFMRYSYIPAPYSIYKNVKKLQPGTYLQLKLGTEIMLDKPKPYWSLSEIVKTGKETPFLGSETESICELDKIMKRAVQLQMVADVPLGAFLSGGVDSSTVVALMQAQSSRPIKTFSIGFNEAGYDEAKHAKAVARYLGTEHTELYISPRQAVDVIPHLSSVYDEPFSDSSQIPTFLVAQMARQHVTVSISGDGGDELFGGYNRYVFTQKLWGLLSLMPAGLRQAMANTITVMSKTAWNRFLGSLQGMIPGKLRLANIGEKIHKGAEVLPAKNNAELYKLLVSHWTERESVVLGANNPPDIIAEFNNLLSDDCFIHNMMIMDTLSYLPDDILCKVDRATMSVSLESRVPFLDHRVVEFAWRLPLSLKLRNGQGKWLLRKVLHQYVPKELIERPKMGFSVPIDSWLRGPLRDWAECLLDESRLRREGIFNPKPILQKWNEHLSSKNNWQNHLWDVLMFQAWLEATESAS